jgi:glycosyltransferase involved in cell wall biosynthesis
VIAPPAPRHTLVIPFYNEAENVRAVMDATLAALRALEGGFEALLVDDGSTDATATELAAIAAEEARVRVITLKPNRGQAAALHAGLKAARGEIILTMDGDGQNDPRDFPELLAVLASGEADLVCGWRADRHDSWLRRVMSRVANLVRARVLRDGLHDGGCQLRVFRRGVIGILRPSPLLQSFIPAMAVAAGFRVSERRVRHHARRGGESKYGLRRLWWMPMREMFRLRKELRAR